MTALRITQVTLSAALTAFRIVVPLARLDAQSSATSTITIRVTGARNSQGKIGVALFRDADGFQGDTTKAVHVQQADIDPATCIAQVVFEGIPQGEYAVSVFHDENMNGKLDKNFVGMPKEGDGASNNPKKRMGPPKFEEAKFPLNQPEQTVEVRLTY